YWPNDGNLGDLLIAEATRQWFRRAGIEYREYCPESPPQEEGITLVYGGGGRFTSHWGGIERHLAHLTHPRVRRGIILPHSFYQVDSFLQGLDERHTIFCRERRSYEYCRSLNLRAAVCLAGDMGLLLDIDALPPLSPLPGRPAASDGTEWRQWRLLRRAWSGRLARAVYRSSVVSAGRRIAFLLRTDREKSSLLSSPLSFDLSLAWTSDCRATSCNAHMIRAMAEALRRVDVVVTDRLHVGIMSHLLGKEVYLLDNDYGKLSAVYAHSLHTAANVHLLGDAALPLELQAAWRHFNSLPRRVGYASRRLCCRLGGALLRRFRLRT
ncbi:MAG: polysaccharide pyruvyl transferase family protein, partial [Akkermansia sp.]